MKKGISQEGLKGIATMTMLIDHIGATLIYAMYRAAWQQEAYAQAELLASVYQTLRIIGRVAFPLYCFLLVEGFCHTRNVKNYMKRLAVGVVLSEIPFDLAISGEVAAAGMSVMMTLLLGCGMLLCMQRTDRIWKRLLWLVPFALAAEVLDTDYGAHGIAIIAMLYLTRGLPREMLWRAVGLAVLLWFGAEVKIGPVAVPIEEFALIGLALLYCYDGRKLTRSKWIQWAFYLFYPVHLLALWALERLWFG